MVNMPVTAPGQAAQVSRPGFTAQAALPPVPDLSQYDPFDPAFSLHVSSGWQVAKCVLFTMKFDGEAINA
jgi:hypothetical protein